MGVQCAAVRRTSACVSVDLNAPGYVQLYLVSFADGGHRLESFDVTGTLCDECGVESGDLCCCPMSANIYFI